MRAMVVKTMNFHDDVMVKLSHTIVGPCLLLILNMYTLYSKKSDAKIQITITMAQLIRINYPLNSSNYRLSGTNIANFNQIHRTVSEQQLFYRAAWNADAVLR